MQIVDQLGALNAQIATLNAQAEAIKKILRESGAGEYRGDVFRAVVSERSSSRIDAKKVRQLLTEEQLAEVVSEVMSTSVSLYDL
jgi:regulator of replication initiation timing